MTTIAALIPRIPRFRWHRTGRVVAIRCTKCLIWRKPNLYNPHANVCHLCCYGEARRRVLERARARG